MSTRGGAWPARLHLVVDFVVAPAELTVSLRITGVRNDGYHLIDAEMVSLDLADRLTISEGDGLEVVGPGCWGDRERRLEPRAPCALSGRPPRPRPGREAHPRGSGVGRRIERCPASSGGPASTIWRSLPVGADVPFCLVGGRPRHRHREIVEPLPFIP